MNETCLHCNGQKGWWITPSDHFCTIPDEFCGHEQEWVKCQTCDGTGKLVGLARAIYIARGGPAPSPLQQTFA